MQKSQINKYIKFWKNAPRVIIEEYSNLLDICQFIEEHFDKERIIVEVPECQNVDNAWLIGIFFTTQNLVSVLVSYKCSKSELPTNELAPDLFFRGIPFNYIEMNDHVYLNDDDTGEIIIIDEYL